MIPELSIEVVKQYDETTRHNKMAVTQLYEATSKFRINVVPKPTFKIQKPV